MMNILLTGTVSIQVIRPLRVPHLSTPMHSMFLFFYPCTLKYKVLSNKEIPLSTNL